MAAGGFTAEEHPIPESLGNATLVLPRGVVCDRCNRSPLSVLDKTLVEFFPVKLRRTTLGVPTKTGSVPATSLSGGGSLVFNGTFAALHGDVAPSAWKEASSASTHQRPPPPAVQGP